MVQQTVDKASEYRLVTNRSPMPSGDKQYPIAVKKVALRELPNESGNVINKPGNSQLVNDKKPAPDSAKLVSPDVKATGTGVKRQNPDAPTSPNSNQSSGKVGPNTSIVYVRRKLEVDHNSTRASSADHPKPPEAKMIDCNTMKVDSEQGQNHELKEGSPANVPDSTRASSADHPKPHEAKMIDCNTMKVDSEQGQNHELKEASPANVPDSTRASSVDHPKPPEAKMIDCNTMKVDSEQGGNHELKEASPANVPATVASIATLPGAVLASHSLGNSFPGLAGTEHEARDTPPRDLLLTSGTSFLGDTKRAVYQEWKDRFVQLQLFLQSCDQSSQEDYIQKLRSLSAVGRSRHAVELETRAIHLFLEEGKELNRMKVLNVLGKGSPRDQASASTQMTSPAQFQR